METIKLYFQYPWGDFDKNDNIFVWIFKQKYNVMVDSIDPDVVVSFGGERLYPRAKYIYFSAEPYYPIDKEEIKRIMDYGCAGFYRDEEKYFRLPLYLYYVYEYMKRGLLDFNFFNVNRSVDITTKKKFCVFIARGFSGRRANFVQRLMNYKTVDISYGQFKNISVPGSGESGSIQGSIDKVNFIKDYKFVVSLENCDIPEGFNGYTTEKLIEPMIANCLPLYYGNYRIDKDFNTNTFLNGHDYISVDAFIEKIIQIDNDDTLYKSYFSQKLKNDTNGLLDINELPKLFFKNINL